MIHLNCPTLGTSIVTDRSELLSTHVTSSGAVAYARCVCEGIVVLGAERGGGWQQTGHAPGSRRPASTGAATAIPEARSA